tara:strand:- start:354 stop:752 length:399 start_codon:yes stop_codon:yes gene_type:complete
MGSKKALFFNGSNLGKYLFVPISTSSALCFAVGLLSILNVGNNMAMKSYRAFVGAGILLANRSIVLFQYWLGEDSLEENDTIPQWLYDSFYIVAILSLVTILWSVLKTPEIPPSDEELKKSMKIKYSLLQKD